MGESWLEVDAHFAFWGIAKLEPRSGTGIETAMATSALPIHISIACCDCSSRYHEAE